MSLMPAPLTARLAVPMLIAVASLCACATSGPGESRPVGAPVPTPSPSGSAQPAPPVPAPPTAPEHPYTPPPRQFHLGPAAGALVAQAHQQAAGGNLEQAAATLERALRIEPDNPLVWIELGRVRLSENIPAQADAMGRKALALATGDPAAQSSAWHLISDSLRARGDNGGAAEADRHAQSLAPH